MTVEYIIVIGTDQSTSENPLARVLDSIGNALGKKIRVFVVTKTGTYEFGRDDIPMPTTDCACRTLSVQGVQSCRLLLFDASSPDAGCNPSAGLLVWQAYYLTLHPEMETKATWIDQVMDFFDQETAVVWWTGLVLPPEYSVKALLGHRWMKEMGSLAHDEANNKEKAR
ncbi:MAG: hypothetical protein ABIJ50_14050 [Pseudomonadota bacterium]